MYVKYKLMVVYICFIWFNLWYDVVFLIDKVELVCVWLEIKWLCFVNYNYKILIIMIIEIVLLFFFSIILR